MLRNGDTDNRAASLTNTLSGLSSKGAGNGSTGLDGNEKVDGCIYPDEVIMENGVVFNVRVTLNIILHK